MKSKERVHKGILDTSTLISLCRIEDPSILPEEPMITTITRAELSVGPLIAQNKIERVKRQAHLQQAEADFNPLPFDAQAARTFGRVVATLKKQGRKATTRSYDAMIAAIAISKELPIYTCNPNDFKGIDELKVISVHVGTEL